MNAPGPGPTRPERGNPYPSGGPAIQPRITAADASTAAYTEADARQYAGRMIGQPDTTLVCYVEVHGNLSTSWMSRLLGARVPSTAHVGVLVFDTQTGNVLIRGLTG